MTIEELQALVAKGESEQLEFKRTTSELRTGMRTVCAMLNNALPGYVLFGVNDGGRIVGQPMSTQTLEGIANDLRKIEPPAFPDIESVPIEDGKAVIMIRISGGTGLYTCEGLPYQRVGPTTSRMPTQIYERRLMERLHAYDRWENWPAKHLSIEDLDQSEIVRTIEEAIRRQRLDEPGTRDPKALLTGLGLIEDGQLVNAAAALFGRPERLLSRYPQCILRMARFRGADKGEFLDNRQEVGNAFDLFIRAQRFLRDYLPVAGRILPNIFERVDDPLYPTEALREALANAICHRDYSTGAGSIGVAIYDDRLEITSIGPLPFGLTPEDLARPHRSRPWNPLIAQVFYRRGIIESWGRGTIKMIELTEQAGLAAPEFDATPHEVTVRFRPTRYIAPTRIGHDLSPLQREILEGLAGTGPASLKQILGIFVEPVPRRTVQDNLQLLRTLGLVDASGKGVGARWFLAGNRP
ncbi:MAG: ATP-binding protein [Thermomicrobiales bacterium]